MYEMPHTETGGEDRPAIGVTIAPHVTVYADRIEVSMNFLSQITNPETRAGQRELFCESIARITQSAEYVARTRDCISDWEAGRS